MQNIGVSFVKMAQFSDAITSFEHIMGEKASFQTGELKTKEAFRLMMNQHGTDVIKGDFSSYTVNGMHYSKLT